MSEKPIAYALTTKNRVKDRIGITGSQFDTLIDRIIAAVTDIIESTCGRRFLRSDYSNEIITIFNNTQEIIAVKNIPLVSVSLLQYRTGLNSNPNYTDFQTDNWEILEDGASGLIRVWGLMHGGLNRGVNAIRISYTAGFLIDFNNAGDYTKHTLPFDLSDLAERLAVKMFKRRENEAKLTETFEGGTVSWKKELIDDQDNDIMNGYKRLPQFV